MPSPLPYLFLVFLISFLLCFGSSLGYKTINGRKIKAIYNLGDSISDTGNLLIQGGISGGLFAAIGRLPYGETSLNTFHRSTGRCSDGKLMIDFLASDLDLPFLNPYLDKDADFKHGVNFAVAGATALAVPNPFTNSSLLIQLEWLKDHLNSTTTSEQDLRYKLKHALIMVGEIGGNDYNYAFISGMSDLEVIKLVPMVVTSIKQVAQEVIDMGTHQIIVPGNFPIGCMPIYLTMAQSSDPNDYDKHKCLKRMNAFANFHNTAIQQALTELRKANPNVDIIYGDYYHSFMHLIRNPEVHGFCKDSVFKACCGNGGAYNFDISNMCGSNEVSTCDNPFDHISWDGVHLTEQAYMTMYNIMKSNLSKRIKSTISEHREKLL